MAETFLGGLSGVNAIYNPAAYGRPDPVTRTSSTGTDVQGQMLDNLPNYQAMTERSSQNILGNLQGQISPDVWANEQQLMAERGVGIGMGTNAPNTNAALAHLLGLTTLDLQNLGQTQLTGAMGRTPIQQTQTGTQQTVGGPDPAAAAAANLAAAQMGLGAGHAVGGGGGGGGGAPALSPGDEYTRFFGSDPTGAHATPSVFGALPQNIVQPNQEQPFNPYQLMGYTNESDLPASNTQFTNPFDYPATEQAGYSGFADDLTLMDADPQGSLYADTPPEEIMASYFGE